jgi:bifunctional DNase/RNase
MTGTEYIRPLTHDLMVTIMDEFGAKPEYVVVKDFKDDIFYADIYLRKSMTRRTVIDCRPSDAIAIALRSDCEIYVAPHVLDIVGIEVKSPELEFKEL